MSAQEMLRDERTVAVENAGYRWSYNVIAFGLLLLAAYRSLVQGESSWDLMLLVIVSGGINVAYQRSQRVIGRRWVFGAVTAAVLAVLLALAVVLLHGRI